MRTVLVLAAVCVCGAAFGADKRKVDPAVALAWATPLPVPTDRFTASDGIVYERHPDGVYRRATVQPASAPVVAPRPFSVGSTPRTGATSVGFSPLQGRAPGSFAGATATGRTTTFALPAGIPGVTNGCPPAG